MTEVGSTTESTQKVIQGTAPAASQHTELAILRLLEASWRARDIIRPLVVWKPREKNPEADFLCNWAMYNRRSVAIARPECLDGLSYESFCLQSWSDGGDRSIGCSAAGCVVKAWIPNAERPVVMVAVAEFITDPSIDSLLAETRGLELASVCVSLLGLDKCFPAFTSFLHCPVHDFDTFRGRG